MEDLADPLDKTPAESSGIQPPTVCVKPAEERQVVRFIVIGDGTLEHDGPVFDNPGEEPLGGSLEEQVATGEPRWARGAGAKFVLC